MFRLSLGLFIVAVIAAIFGFTGIAAGAAFFAKIVFVIALAGLAISLIFGGIRRID